MDKTSKRKLAWGHYLLAIFLLCAMVASFFVFTRQNQARIASQNQEYARDVATQTASRVEDMIQARIKSLNVLSLTVSETIDRPWVGQQFLELLQETSIFDYVEFIDRNGVNHNAKGQTSDSSDRVNYLKGIQGETGFHVIYNSRITHETLIDFYAPVTYDGEIIGVLNGMFREESLRQALSVEFFGVDATSFICMDDGTVISSYGYSDPMENLLEGLEQDHVVSEEMLAEIEDAFAAHRTFCYTGKDSSGGNSVSLVPIGESWMLVQVFPSAVTKQMEKNANEAGIGLELRLALLFLIYVVYLIVTGLRSRHRLTSEKNRLSGIVGGLTPLFARLAIVDFEKRTYEYLQGTPSGLPTQGSMASLKSYMSTHYLSGDDAFSSAPSFDWEEIKISLGEGIPYCQYEYRIHWEEDRWENASVLSLQQKDGMPVSVIVAIQDVTALKQQEDAIQQTLRDAFHTAEDLSQAKSDFLARMSHDMRTPMNAVLGMAAIALSHLDDHDRVQDCLEKIDASGRRFLSLINDVLDMSKIESGGIVLKEKAFCLPDKVDMVVEEMRDAATKKGLQMNIDIAQFTHEDVQGDFKRLQQVLVNLLDNAVQYTPSGGSITFKAQELPAQTSKSGYYEFIVEDTGVGIDSELQPKIFEPFVRAESARSDLGTGLGLTIAQTIVKLMDGEIKVESKPGHGSRFTVHVFLKLQGDRSPQLSAQREPAYEEKEEQCACTEDESGAITRHVGASVLLVEDNALNMEIALELLTEAGLQVETAENGAEAVSMVQEHPQAYYDLVFMDLQMPVMDGYEAARTIRHSGREDLRNIPIVAVSANAFQENVSQAKDAGMNDHIMKPVDLDKFLTALDKWLPKGKDNGKTDATSP